MSTITSLSVIIPSYNEKPTLNNVLDEVVEVLCHTGIVFEVIVVDDGSCDGSAELLLSRAYADRRIRFERHARNLGKGAALRTGFLSSSCEWVLFVDADLQIPMSELGPFQKASADADSVIGFRRNKRYSSYRLALSSIYRFIVRIFFGINISDIGCPFKLFRRETLRDVSLTTSGFGVDVELMWRLAQSGCKIIELPVDSRQRIQGTSKVTFQKVVGCIIELLRLRVQG
jgi:glycosyltransferase involved in cell wall biosynthesis